MNGSALRGTDTVTVTDILEARSFAEAAALAEAPLCAGSAETWFLAPWWWRTMEAAGLEPGARARFLIYREAAVPLCLLALRESADGQTDSLTGPYTCLYQPLFAPSTDAPAMTRAGTALAALLRRRGLIRLDALDADAPWLTPFLTGLRAGGVRPLRFDHFGNWHEPIAGRDWEAYLRDRSGSLRETIRRKTRRNAGVTLRIVTGGPDLDDAIAGYEDVYARSWKVPEPFPRFNARMMREAATAGALRLGLLESAGQVIAAQIWIVANASAMVVKLAHDEAFKPLSPGTVLTAWMIRHLIDEEHVRELDFGRGDDPYKELWTTARRQRIGVLLANPWRPAGALAIARHLAGVARRKLGR